MDGIRHGVVESRGGGKRILVVDDNLDMRNILSLTLSRRGYAVAAAEGALEALPVLSITH